MGKIKLKRKLVPHLCIDCQKEFTAVMNQIRCASCLAIHTKAYHLAYYQTHKSALLEKALLKSNRRKRKSRARANPPQQEKIQSNTYTAFQLMSLHEGKLIRGCNQVIDSKLKVDPLQKDKA